MIMNDMGEIMLAIGRLEADGASASKQRAEIFAQLKELQEAKNKGLGILIAVGSVGGLLGTLVSFILSKVGDHI